MNVCRLIPTDQCHYLKVADPISRIECDSQKAARQTITREELALFDASARSWLSSADEVKISEQKRLMLILKNICTPVSVGSTTYGKVVMHGQVP